MPRVRALRPGDLLAGLVPLLALFPLHNNDLWWHLATGRWIVANHAVPRSDIFSWTNYIPGWVDNEWLAQLIFFGVWGAGGDAALIALRAALFAAIALLLRQVTVALRVPRSFPAALAVAIALSHHWWELRPSLFSMIGLLLLILAIERRVLRLLPFLFLLWANLHPGFLFGLTVLAAVLVASFLERLTSNWRRSNLNPEDLALALAGSIAASVVNPYGLRVFSQQFAIAGNREYRMLLDEWLVPPLPFLAVVVIAFVLAMANIRAVPLHRLAIYFACATLSITAVRFEEYFAWLAIPFLMTFPVVRKRRVVAEVAAIVIAVFVGWFPPAARPADRFSAFHRSTTHRQRIASTIAATGALAAIAMQRRRVRPAYVAGGAAALAALALVLLRPTHLVEPNRYPGACAAAIPGNVRLFNRLSWGGWLIWKRSLPVFIDGRCSGQPLFFEFIAAQVRHARPVLDRRGVDWVIAGSDDGVVRQLLGAREWTLACRDETAFVFQRKSLSAREFSP